MKFAAPSENDIPLIAVSANEAEGGIPDLSYAQQAWVKANDFSGKIAQRVICANEDGSVAAVVVGLGTDDQKARTRFGIADGVKGLPDGTYALRSNLSGAELEQAALGLLLGAYKFTRYAGSPENGVQFVAPDGVDARKVEIVAAGESLTRDLINTPANDMGPQELQNAVEDLCNTHGATLTVIAGDDLLDQNFPMIHTVGRASDRAPRLLDMRWGKSGPSLTLVGKGVCFDTGGLNLKSAASMGLMKKDMGGAATVLGLAHMIMELALPMRLRVLIPAVENSVGGSSFRPSDILTSRKGLTVEINNTDAEGRLVLADALAYAEEDAPDQIISFATLTGAARVAVGPDIAPFYTTNPALAAALPEAAEKVADPVWQMPFHRPYEAKIEPGVADLDNAPSGGFAGSITAALFLNRFVETTPYTHFDIYGWQPAAAPARPKGGVGQGARALLEALQKVLSL